MIVATVLTNGRIELLDRTIASFEDKLRDRDKVTRRVIWDDSGSDEVYNYLIVAYVPAGWTITRASTGAAEGFGGAMRSAWAWLADRTIEPYVFWIEDDFIFEKIIGVDAMVSVLDANPYIAQMALRRQPWNAAEIEAGGVVELDPGSFLEVTDGKQANWLEHRRFFTTNPSIFRRDLLVLGWADDPHSEGKFTHRLLGEGLPSGVPGHEVRFAYWGSRRSAPAITHIGLERVGFGY